MADLQLLGRPTSIFPTALKLTLSPFSQSIPPILFVLQAIDSQLMLYCVCSHAAAVFEVLASSSSSPFHA